MKPRRRWVPIVFGIAVLIAFVGIGAVIAVTAWFQQNLQVEQRSLSDAETEFETVRKKFGGRRPLLEMRDGHPTYSAERAEGQPNAAGGSVQTLHVLVWDPEDEKLARFTLPFWLLRMKSDPIRFGAYTSGMDDRVDLRPEDIEKYGPGIILDAGSSRGERFLLWAQ